MAQRMPGVYGLLDLARQRLRFGRGVAVVEAFVVGADAVFGAEAAAELADHQV